MISGVMLPEAPIRNKTYRKKPALECSFLNKVKGLPPLNLF